MRVLISGASGNVGTACINYFCSQEDNQVYGLSRTTPKTKHYDNFTFSNTNLNKFYQIEQAMRLFNHCQFNIVIMAHGTQEKVTIGKEPLASAIKIIDSNLTSALNLTNILIRNQLLTQGSLIVYSGSIQATQPRAGRGPYAIAKAGLEALAKIVAVEQSPKTRAICLRMGQLSKQMKDIVFDEEQVKSIEDVTFAKLPTPKEIAQLCDTFYHIKGVTGSVIDIDSGHHLSIWPKEKYGT